MNTNPIHIRRALISVSDKTGVVDLAQELQKNNVEIVSTGGTAKALALAGIAVTDVATYTGYPELMNGRVKTLHPKIFGGILGLRDAHEKEARAQAIPWIDLVICNLYPFETAIDIGGVALIRAAAKNQEYVCVVIDPHDYDAILKEVSQGGIRYETRRRLSAKAFGYIAAYDALIYRSLATTAFPETLILPFKKKEDLRYGENPHQKAAFYVPYEVNLHDLGNARLHQGQGKVLSYNNLADASAAIELLAEFSNPSCVIIKHGNPCGAAVSVDIATAFNHAYSADAVAAFGGVIGLNRPCTKDIASEIARVFAEVIIAPSYEPSALAALLSKKNMRVLEIQFTQPLQAEYAFRSVTGGMLVQEKNTRKIIKTDLETVTLKKPTEEQIEELLFAYAVVKHLSSNAIVITENHTTKGIGAGQVSRIDAVHLALKKAGDKLDGAVLASDAFFPFRDSIDALSQSGISAVIQPGGSLRDDEVISACNEVGLAMVFTGVRGFKH